MTADPTVAARRLPGLVRRMSAPGSRVPALARRLPAPVAAADSAVAVVAVVFIAALAGCAAPPQPWPQPQPSPPSRAPATTAASDAHAGSAGGDDLPALPAAGSGRGAYYQDDGPGEHPPPGLRDVPDAALRIEPYAKFANRPYAVFGKTYTPLLHDEPLVERGVASWYGKKFHGQRTSSGELYDMYKMTAAHPTLPIPSYARITSLDSGKQVLVRINDRGPFHGSRVVDVSYAAALRLGLLEKGSHHVEIARLLPAEVARLTRLGPAAPATPGRPATAPPDAALAAGPSGAASAAAPSGVAPATAVSTTPPSAAALAIAALMHEDRDPLADLGGATLMPPAMPRSGFYLQLGAYTRADKADEIRVQLMRSSAALRHVDVEQAGAVHRVLGGPFATRAEAAQAAQALPAALGLKPIVVRR